MYIDEPDIISCQSKICRFEYYCMGAELEKVHVPVQKICPFLYGDALNKNRLNLDIQ